MLGRLGVLVGDFCGTRPWGVGTCELHTNDRSGTVNDVLKHSSQEHPLTITPGLSLYLSPLHEGKVLLVFGLLYRLYWWGCW